MKGYSFVIMSLILVACNVAHKSFVHTEQSILAGTKATRYINNCDFDCNVIKPDFELNPKGSVSFSVDKKEKYQGVGCFKYAYKFNDTTNSLSMKQVWWDKNRSELSFHPLGISIWIKGNKENDDALTITLLQQNETFTLNKNLLDEFGYRNDTILKPGEWRQLILPYHVFEPSDNNSEKKLKLDQVAGIKFSVINRSKKPHAGTLFIDAIQQLTSFDPTPRKQSRFTSIFIQPNYKIHASYDWSRDIAGYKSVGIDTVIIQYATNHQDNTIFFYKGSKSPFGVSKEYDILESIVRAAELHQMKVILGLNGGRYPVPRDYANTYDTLFEKNKIVIDELYSKFANSPSMAGWYIIEEFDDGNFKPWKTDQARMLLSTYLQNVAAYAKSKPKKYIVCVAPQLAEGGNARYVGEFYRTIFSRTPDIDNLYIQDCGGRCYVDEDDYDVFLPQYFETIKKACEETGISFGVDVESFERCPCEGIRQRARPWKLLKQQLDVAGLYTNSITQFSWATFRPGVGAFDEYKKYVTEN